MELIMEDGLLPAAGVNPVRQEAVELTAIMAASRLSAIRAGQIANRKSKITGPSLRRAVHRPGPAFALRNP